MSASILSATAIYASLQWLLFTKSKSECIVLSTQSPIRTSMNPCEVRCSGCRRKEAIFFRRYSGQQLCKKCFVESIESKVRTTITKYDMFNLDDKIAVAVSGGKDSLSLLRILATIERKRAIFSLTALTVDEGIVGYRDEALELASIECKKLGVSHHIVSFKEQFGFTLDELIQKKRLDTAQKLTPCAYCGMLRRRALNLGARKIGANKLATGHTLDDEAQTILMNIFRGDVQRLAKEKPTTDVVHPCLIQRVKPLCEIPENESALYAYLKKVKFQAKPCPYASEAMRNDFRRILNQMEAKHAGTKYTVFSTLERLRPGLHAIKYENTFTICSECGEPSTGSLCKVCQVIKEMES